MYMYWTPAISDKFKSKLQGLYLRNSSMHWVPTKDIKYSLVYVADGSVVQASVSGTWNVLSVKEVTDALKA